MTLEVCTIGGFSECGRNCTAIKVDDEVIIIDLGLELESYIKHTQDDRDDLVAKEYDELVKVAAVPNIDHIKDWHFKIKAIIPSHAHLDHIGAIPFVSPMFPNVPIVSTPYTIEVIKAICKDERLKLPNKLITQELNSTYTVSDKIEVEFIEVTHSIPHTAMLKIKTPYGTIVYANDYKLDHKPTLGPAINIKKLKQAGKDGVDLLICESLYAKEDRHTLSESDAKQMLEDALLNSNDKNLKNKGIIVTTFSSQIARLKSLIEIGQKMNRQVIFIGRSMRKYCTAAQRIRIVDFPKSIPFHARRPVVQNALEKIQRDGPPKYLIVCTGHQGEPKAQLSRISRGETGLNLNEDWLVIFSCSVIPVQTNIEHRKILEKELGSKNVKILKDLHASGHASGKDHEELINILKPKKIIPSHAGENLTKHLIKIAKKLGYKEGDTVIQMQDGKRLKLK